MTESSIQLFSAPSVRASAAASDEREHPGLGTGAKVCEIMGTPLGKVILNGQKTSSGRAQRWQTEDAGSCAKRRSLPDRVRNQDLVISIVRCCSSRRLSSSNLSTTRNRPWGSWRLTEFPAGVTADRDRRMVCEYSAGVPSVAGLSRIARMDFGFQWIRYGSPRTAQCHQSMGSDRQH